MSTEPRRIRFDTPWAIASRARESGQPELVAWREHEPELRAWLELYPQGPTRCRFAVQMADGTERTAVFSREERECHGCALVVVACTMTRTVFAARPAR